MRESATAGGELPLSVDRVVVLGQHDQPVAVPENGVHGRIEQRRPTGGHHAGYR